VAKYSDEKIKEKFESDTDDEIDNLGLKMGQLLS
jgi:hypothetical protein